MKNNTKSIIAKDSYKLHESFKVCKTSYEYSDIRKHLKAEKFLSELKIFNKVTGEIKRIEYDKEWTLRQNYLYRTFVADDIRYQAHSMGFEAFFITATLPSQYHPFITSKSNGKSYKNRNYKGHSIADGAEKLKEFCRALTNDFKVERKRIKTFFVRVVEPHKSMVAHNHMLIFVPKNLMKDFRLHHQRTIERFGFDNRGQDIKDLSDSKNPRAVTTYLFKYVEKTLDGSNSWINGWLSQNEISRVMTNSRGSLNREIFKKLSSIVPHNPKDDKPYLIQLRNVCVIKTMLVSTKGKHLKTKFQRPFNGSEPRYSIFHKKEVDIIDMPKTYKVRKTFEYSESELSAFQMKQERIEFIENMEGGAFGDDMIVLSIIFKDVNKYEMEIMEILEERTYKTLELTITESSSNKLLYNKKDLCVFDKHIHFVQKRKKIITMSDYEEIIFNETVVLGGW